MQSTLLLRLTTFLVVCICSISAHADPLPTWTFQLPVSRNSHSFILWQSTGPLSSPVQIPTVPGNTYSVSGFDNAYYFDLNAQFDQTLGEFWLEDITPATHETSAHNTLALTHAPWRTPSSTPKHYLALPEARLGHVFSLEQAGGATYGMTNGALQLYADVNGSGGREWFSYGYFEAWAEFSAAGYQFYRIIDHTTGERTGWLPFTHSNLVSAQWVLASATSPLRAVSIMLAPGQVWRDFVLYSSHGPAQTLRAVQTMHWNGTAFVSDPSATVSGSVCVGMDYWLVRVADGKSSLESLPLGLGHMGQDNQIVTS